MLENTTLTTWVNSLGKAMLSWFKSSSSTVKFSSNEYCILNGPQDRDGRVLKKKKIDAIFYFKLEKWLRNLQRENESKYDQYK